MIKAIKYLLPVLIILMFSISCKKYDEGPGISFRKAKTRLIGKWKLSSYTINGAEMLNSWKYEVKKSVYCKLSGEKIILEGPGTERATYKEINFEFCSNSDYKWYSRVVYEELDIVATENLCKPVWTEFSSGEWNRKLEWSLDENKEFIICNSDLEQIKFEILRLKNKEMKLREVNYNGTIEYVMEKVED